MKCLHIEIARHPYLKTGWDLRIGDLKGCVGITTPEESKQEILDEISRSMDELDRTEKGVGISTSGYLTDGKREDGTLIAGPSCSSNPTPSKEPLLEYCAYRGCEGHPVGELEKPLIHICVKCNKPMGSSLNHYEAQIMHEECEPALGDKT
jgi:hypothetical protein